MATTVFAVYGPVGTGALRFALAAPVLLLLARPALRGRSRGFWLSAVALGVALPGLNFTLYEAISRLPLGTVVTLQFLGPLALALVSVRRRLDVIWVAAAGAGVGLIAGGPDGGSAAGVLLALVAAVAVLGLAVPYALEYIAIRRVTVRTFSVLLSLDPAIAALAGVLWLGQRLGGSEAIGIGLVVLASSGVIVTRRH
jgi:inner membrane transporter RhtA